MTDTTKRIIGIMLMILSGLPIVLTSAMFHRYGALGWGLWIVMFFGGAALVISAGNPLRQDGGR